MGLPIAPPRHDIGGAGTSRSIPAPTTFNEQVSFFVNWRRKRNLNELREEDYKIENGKVLWGEIKIK